jgi:type IV pilus assembly protein PilV
MIAAALLSSARPCRRSLRQGSSARARRAAAAGYTVLEVMMAMAVLSIGATGVIAMQKATMIGNVHARDLATANAVAMAWVERLRADSLRWKLDDSGISTIGSTTWLNKVGTDFPAIANPENVWFRPDDIVDSDISAAADARGADTFDDADNLTDNPGFCTHVRLLQLTPNTIRADVRVFWLKRQGTGTVNGDALCSTDGGYVDGVGAAIDSYHYVYVSTALLRNDVH